MQTWRLIGDIFVEDFNIAQEHVDAALAEQKQTPKRLGEILQSRQIIDSTLLARALAVQHDLDFINPIPDETKADDLLALIPINFAKQYQIFPLARNDSQLQVALCDPTDSRPLNDLATLTGALIEPCLTTPEEILRAINRVYEKQAGGTDEVIEEIEDRDNPDLGTSFEPRDLLDTSDEAPIIRFVNSLSSLPDRRHSLRGSQATP
jgi:general secretion pathway protein E